MTQKSKANFQPPSLLIAFTIFLQFNLISKLSSFRVFFLHRDDTDLNLKKQKRFKKETKQVFERGDDWFDPWSRKKIKRREENQNSSSSSEEESSRKSLKRK